MRNIAPAPDRLPLTVIVADSSPFSRAALAALLSYDGYRVFQAENAGAAISRIISVDNLGVILADLDMPGWRSIVGRAVERTNALVIGLEGNVRFSKTCDLKQLGIGLCIQKPLVYDNVRRAILENSGRPHDEAPHRKAA
jgi:CheY-like chemotaxis protein